MYWLVFNWETQERHRGTLVSLNSCLFLLSLGYCQALLHTHTQRFTLESEILSETFITFTSFVFLLSRIALLHCLLYAVWNLFHILQFLNHLMWAIYSSLYYSILARCEHSDAVFLATLECLSHKKMEHNKVFRGKDCHLGSTLRFFVIWFNFFFLPPIPHILWKFWEFYPVTGGWENVVVTTRYLSISVFPFLKNLNLFILVRG